ncbi:MAG: hypothetical protein ABI528_01590 [bacterium]
MENHSKAKKEFNEKLGRLKKETEPALYDQNLKEVVIYEKLLELQDQINMVSEKIETEKSFETI